LESIKEVKKMYMSPNRKAVIHFARPEGEGGDGIFS